MDIINFKQSLSLEHPPAGLSPLLLALWYDAKGNWEKSHNIISEIHTVEASLIHAYLHRKEGDIWNADYWYKRAGQSRKDISLEAEWTGLLEKLIA